MKKYLFSVFLILFLFRILPAANAIRLDSLLNEIPVLAPKPIHPRVEQIVTYLLSSQHYQKKQLDDSLSSQVFDNYLEILDGGKLYFLASDIASFEKYRYHFDEYLKRGYVKPAYDIYNVFSKRFAERYAYIIRRLNQPFDFTIDEYFSTDRESRRWVQTPAQLDSLWRLRLKNEALNLKLAGKKEEKIYQTLKKRYRRIFKRVRQTESEDVFQWFMNAFAECFDPHTTYLSPKVSEDFKIRMSLSLEGIGATLRTEDDYTLVVQIVPGGPADRSGLLHPNDRIIGVGQGDNGEIVDVIGWRIDDVVQLIRGKKGTKVRLQILPADAPEGSPPDTITIVRDKVRLADRAAKSDTLQIEIEGKQHTFGVIDIPDFYLDYEAMRRGDPDYASTSGDVRKLIRQLQGAGIEGLIIDLRNNGGGFLSEAIRLTGLFIPRGPVVQVKDTRGNIRVERDSDPEIVYQGPLIVLVNRFSASASEIFAGAIQDYQRGIIIGDQTFGKGTVQNMVKLKRFLPQTKEKLGQLKLTIAKFYRITGRSTQKVGVIPDIELPSKMAGLKIGERSEKNALQWDQIRPVDFVPFEPDLKDFIPRLRSRYLSRLNTAPELKYLQDEAENLKKERERKLLPLQATKREQLRAQAEKLKKRQKEIKEKLHLKNEDEIYITEAAHILNDYLKLRQ